MKALLLGAFVVSNRRLESDGGKRGANKTVAARVQGRCLALARLDLAVPRRGRRGSSFGLTATWLVSDGVSLFGIDPIEDHVQFDPGSRHPNVRGVRA